MCVLSGSLFSPSVFTPLGQCVGATQAVSDMKTMVQRIRSVHETLKLLQHALLTQQQQQQQDPQQEEVCRNAGGVQPSETFDAAHTLALVHDAEELLREQESRARSRSPRPARRTAAANAFAELFVAPARAPAASSASPVPPQRTRGRANSLKALFANPPSHSPAGGSTPGSPAPCDDAPSPRIPSNH